MPTLEDEFVALNAEIRSDDGHRLYEQLIGEAHAAIMQAARAEKEQLQSECNQLGKALQEAHTQLGRDFEAPNLPLRPLRSRLDAVLRDAKLELGERRAIVQEHLDRCHAYCKSLGIPEIAPPSRLTPEDIERILQQRRQLEKRAREQRQYYESLAAPVIALQKSMQVDGPLSGFDLASNLQPSTEALITSEHERLLQTQRSLAAQVDSRTAEIKELAHLLRVEPVLSAECSAPNAAALEATLTGLKRTFQDFIESAYEDERNKYLEKCAFLGVEPEPRVAVTEQSYKELVAKIGELQRTIEQRAKLDTYAAELCTLEQSERELQQAEQNPGRLKARGSVLQDECRLRQRLSIRKPKVVQKLRSMVTEWLAEHGRYVYNGRDLGEEMSSMPERGRALPRVRRVPRAPEAPKDAPKDTPKTTPRPRAPRVTPKATPRPRVTPASRPPVFASNITKPTSRIAMTARRGPTPSALRRPLAPINTPIPPSKPVEFDPNFSGIDTDLEHQRWREAKLNQLLEK